MVGVRGRCTLPDGVKGQTFFSPDMLLETHLGVNNYAKFTQIGDNIGWTMMQNVVNNISDTIKSV